MNDNIGVFRLLVGFVKSGNGSRPAMSFPVNTFRIASHTYFERAFHVHFQKSGEGGASLLAPSASMRRRVKNDWNAVLHQQPADKDHRVIKMIAFSRIV